MWRGDLSRRVRVGLLVAVLGLAGGLYWLGSARHAGRSRHVGGPDPTGRPPKTGESGQRWYQERVSFWESLEYTPLTDAERLRQTVSNLVQARYPGAAIDEELLIRDLTAFLQALAADSPEEYLRRVSARRVPRDDLFLDKAVHGWYRQATGDDLPRDADARHLLARFWRERDEGPGRPSAVATKGIIQIDHSRPLPPEGLPSGYLLFNATIPKFSWWSSLPPEEVERWIGPFGQGFPQITRPTVIYDDLFHRLGSVLVCEVFVPMRTSAGRPFLTSIALYFSPEETCWHIHWFANYYPYWVCWAY